MLDPAYERINEYDSVSIKLASPQDIRSWSYGEVKKPETINYRTYRSEKDGLFCERIFGPERDWECFCGKYKGIKHRGITCSRCGVTVTHSRVRRKRMGHITLAAPVIHIWFFKSMPCRIGILLGVKVSHLERVVYYQDYIVTDPGETPLQPRQLLSEDDYQAAVKEYGEGSFKADMGAASVRTLLKQVNLDELTAQLRVDYEESGSKQKRKDIVKRLKIAEDLRNSGNKPEWMVLEVIPVIPPDLRPLVLLESGNFATSDLNDLYRRLINRNNRLKKLVELNAPEVIIRNEKRMLQQSVDALFDNNRCRRPVLGSNSRPLRSLTDMIKGKQGRFRENLLGKRVDYSARSVIVVGPELKLHQCGLPKKIALELYQPFIIRRLKELGYADTIRSAKKMLERKDEEVWDILEDVIRDHPVMLNRAPTLHRMGIQAFQPVLVEGNAIKIHPLVCPGFNADFDGDQMAVHLPLSLEAQVEAKMLMMSINNIFSPSHGGPIIAPNQDMVLGCHYLSSEVPGEKGSGMRFSSPMELMTAHAAGKLEVHALVEVRMPAGRKVLGREGLQSSKNGVYTTTPGRVKFNDILPKGMSFYNYMLAKKDLQAIVADCHELLGLEPTLKLLDDMKELGFKEATLAGLSFTVTDLCRSPEKPKILAKTGSEVAKVEKAYQKGVITEGERYNQIIDRWVHATEEVGEDMMKQLANDTREGRRYLNPIHLMVKSGARGSLQQVRQLAGMRGLMAKPSGKIIETPIRANFREGLRVCEYFSSTHGARKGLADTALKTADSGYLTRKLADVAQNVVVSQLDCGTLSGITKGAVRRGDKMELSLSRAIRGRVARDTIVNIATDEVIVKENQIITAEIAKNIEEHLGEDSKIRVRSGLTCESPIGICAKCYGMDLSTGQLAEQGLAVGIIAAQSIGEPGTQLTMRTFHIGGVAFRGIEEGKLAARHSGRVTYRKVNTVLGPDGRTIVLNKNARIDILDAKGRPRDTEGYSPPIGAVLKVKDKQKVDKRHLIATWDPHMVPILSEKAGVVSFEDVVPDETVKDKLDTVTGIKKLVVIEHKGNLHPQIVVKHARDGKILGVYPIPEKAHIEVDAGQKVTKGTLLSKTPREITGTQDITGGLPRVTELFEVRKPKIPAVLSEIEGVVELGEKRRGKRTVIVRNESGMTHEHLIPPGRYMRVHAGDYVRNGDPLVEGALIPQDILRIKGQEAVQQYLLREVQGVYRSQNVPIDDKHIEIIVSQMMRRVSIQEPGDTDLLPQSVVDKFAFKASNEEVLAQKKKPATCDPLLLGITKSALQSDSFISAASFQETTKVLTGAALAGRIDNLVGLKENVILGHMIPAGTGFRGYRTMRVKRDLLSDITIEPSSAIEEDSRVFK